MTVVPFNSNRIELFTAVPRIPGLAPTIGDEGVSDLKVDLSIDDALIRESVPGFDGLEQPFVLVPRGKPGEEVWEKYALGFDGHSKGGYFAQKVLDLYEGRIHDVDFQAISRLGIAIGLGNDLWLQEAGRNLGVSYVNGKSI